MAPDGLNSLGAAAVYAAYHVIGVSRESGGQRCRSLVELTGDGVAKASDRLHCPGAAPIDSANHVVGVSAHGVSSEFGSVGKPGGDPIAMDVDGFDDGVLRGLNALDQIVAPLADAEQQVFADCSETAVNV